MKKNIILVLVTAIIFTGVGVIATTAITADQINYDENTTVKDKIDDLYQLKSVDSIDNANDYGIRLASRSKSINLTKGDYLIFVSIAFGTSPTDAAENTYSEDDSTNTVCSGCELIKLSSRSYNISGTVRVPSFNYLTTNHYTSIYRTSVSNQATITATSTWVTDNSYMGQIVEIYALKLK